MRALLCLGVLLLACSSNVDVPSAGDGGASGEPSVMDAAGMAGRPVAGSASGLSPMVKGGSAGAAAGGSAGASVAGGGQGGAAGATAAPAGGGGQGGNSQGGSSVAASAGAGAGGAEPVAGVGGSIAGAAGEPSSEFGGAGGDAGTEPACVCSSGPCCDGCHYLPPSHFCGEVVRTGQCLATGSIDLDYWNLFCSGDTAAACTRWGAHTKYATGKCSVGTTCAEAGDQASCVAN